MRNPFPIDFFRNNRAPRAVRHIQISSAPSNQELENPTEIVMPNHQPMPQLITPLPLQLLKIAIVPIFAAASSLPLPILIIVIQEQFGTQSELSLEQKILQPLLPYLVLAAFRTWLIWNNIGHRMNGHVDTDMPAPNDAAENAPWHVTAAFIANTSKLIDALLVVLVVLSNKPTGVRWSAALAVGSLNYVFNLYMEVAEAFRKHVESKQKQGQQIAPLFKQKHIDKVIYNHAERFGIIMRELLPIIAGTIRAVVTTEAATALLPATMSKNQINAVTVPLRLATYFASAYSIQFELVQFRDNLKAAGRNFEIENKLSQSSVPVIRLLGVVSNGHILVDILKKLRFSTRTSVNITLAFVALGFMALLQKAMHEYVSSEDASAVAANQKGIVMSYCVGHEEATRLAPKIETGITCIAISLGLLGTFARAATLHKRTHDLEAESLARTAISNDNDIEEAGLGSLH
ncbi:MAG: hypothetical protein NTU48_10310 [Legionellales bacterium]|nr:hypothetical protein [Legionellales bacterium]